jgi:predicted phage-related endonuclease
MADPWRPRDTIGASDAPAVVGCDPHRTAADLWCEKTGRLPIIEADDAEADVFALGHAVEPVLIAAAARRLGVLLASEVAYRHPDPDVPMSATVDAHAVADGIVVECKTAGLLGPSPLLSLYGRDDTDEVPDAVIVQAHHQVAVVNAQPHTPPIRTIVVPALLGGRGLHIFKIVPDPALVAELIAYEVEWWQRHVVADLRPPELPSLRTLRALRRRPDLPAVPLDESVVQTWLAAKAALKTATATEETVRRHVLAGLGDAERGVCAAGRLSYIAHERAAYTVAAQTVRTLRFTAARDQEDSR